MISTKKKVLVIMTGGTICSARGNNRLNDLDTDNAVLTLLSMYQEQTGDYDKEILTASPINTLSENMTIDKWNLLLSELAKYKASKEPEGIIILHGTDTLHLTAPLVAEYMKGAKVPAILISSQRILEDPEANGVMNLMVGMKLIELGIPGVYVPFRNMDGRMFLHLAEDLEECPDYSEDFHSRTEMLLDMTKPDYGIGLHNLDKLYRNDINDKIDGGKTDSDTALFEAKKDISYVFDNEVFSDDNILTNSVIYIKPYVGIDYSIFRLDNAKAVLLNLYHSSTVRTEGGDMDKTSAMYLLKECKQRDIPLYIFPCESGAYRYASTKPLLDGSAIPLYGGTWERNYIRLLMKYSLKK